MAKKNYFTILVMVYSIIFLIRITGEPDNMNQYNLYF